MRHYSCRVRLIVTIDLSKVIHALAVAAYLLLSGLGGSLLEHSFRGAPADPAIRNLQVTPEGFHSHRDGPKFGPKRPGTRRNEAG
jgi:hypothetical protein